MSETKKKKNISITNKTITKSNSLQTSKKTKTPKKTQIKIAQKAKPKRNNTKAEKKELLIDSNDDLLNSIEIKTIEKKEDIEIKNEPVKVENKEKTKKSKTKDTKSKKTSKVKTALPRPVKKEIKQEEKHEEAKHDEPKHDEPKQEEIKNIEINKPKKKDTKSKKTTKVKSALPRPVKKDNKSKDTEEKQTNNITEENNQNIEVPTIDVEIEENKGIAVKPKEENNQLTQEEKTKENEKSSEESETELSKTTAMKIKTKFKKAIYEEIEDDKYKKEQKDKKKKFKYYFPIIIGIIIIIALVFLIIYKYDENYRNSLRKYKIYSIGEKVILKDDSEWNVIEYSGERDDKVLILRSQNLDMNNDGTFGNEDKLPISKTSVNYTIEEEGTVGYFLENEYKGKLVNQVGKIYEIRLLTSKEYIKIRNTSGFGYEWTEGNWLANNSIKGWWLGDSKGDYSICVAEKGSYVLRKPGRGQYIRPVILISKDDIKNV